MPRYDYSCAHCGPFTAWRPMSEYAAPSECPGCGGPAPREIGAPFIAGMNPDSRIAHERNERSAHEPRVMSRGQMERLGSRRSGGGPERHAHHHEAGGHGHHRHSGRPWMIGH